MLKAQGILKGAETSETAEKLLKLRKYTTQRLQEVTETDQMY